MEAGKPSVNAGVAARAPAGYPERPSRPLWSRTEQRCRAYARASQRRSSARHGGSIPTDRRPYCHPPALARPAAVSAPSALAPSYAVAPAILGEPPLSLRARASSLLFLPRLPVTLLLSLYTSLLFCPLDSSPLFPPTPPPPPRPPPPPPLPRNQRRCTRRLHHYRLLSLAPARARARYLRRLTSRTYVRARRPSRR